MDASQENPSTEHQLMKTVSNMMTKLTEATQLSSDQLKMLLNMQTQLHNLREQLEAHEEASRARSNGAAVPKVLQKNKRTGTSPLPELDSAVPVFQATAYVVPDEVQDDDKSLKPPPGSASAGASAGATQNNDEVRDDAKKEKNNAWRNFCAKLNKDPTHKEFSATLSSLGKKSKYASAVWNTMKKEEREAYKIKDPAHWPPLPAPCADNLAKALVEDGTPDKRRQTIDDTKKASAGKEQIDTDSDEEHQAIGQKILLPVDFDWTEDAMFYEMAKKWKFFKEELLDARSLWYLNKLTTCTRTCLGQWATTKDEAFAGMLQKQLKTMDGLNALIKDHLEPLLSEPCCLKITQKVKEQAEDGSTVEIVKIVDEWDPQIITAMKRWESQIKTSSNTPFLTRFRDSALHNCTLADFEVVKKAVNYQIFNDDIEMWNDFATALLRLCKEQPGNGPRDKKRKLDSEEEQPGNGPCDKKRKLDREALLAEVEREFIRDPT